MARRQTGTIAAGGFLMLIALGLVDTLALLPRVLTPSSNPPEVRASIATRSDLAPVLAGPVLWGLVCAAMAVWSLPASRRPSALRIDAVALIGLGALALLLQCAALGMTLWLSNHLPPFEGGSTALGTALALLGALATSAGLLLLAIRTARRRKPESAT
jgi:hypothetical protein